jgi:protein O-mannosyl-transferase
MYLPLAAVAVLLVSAAYSRVGRWTWCAGAIVALVFGGLTLQRNHTYRSALTMWQDTVAKRPANPLAQDNLAVSLRAAGQIDAALVHHRRATELAPGVAGFHYTYGTTLFAANRPTEAAREFAEAVRLAPEWVEANHDLGIARLDSGQLAGATGPLAFAAAHDSANPQFRYDYGTALLRAGQAAAAMGEFEAALRLDPNNALAHHDLGAAFSALGRYADALPEFEAAIRLNPADLRARNNRANVLGALGRFGDARAEFETVLRADPSNATARDGLARLNAATR